MSIYTRHGSVTYIASLQIKHATTASRVMEEMDNLSLRSIWLHRPGRGVGVISPDEGILICICQLAMLLLVQYAQHCCAASSSFDIPHLLFCPSFLNHLLHTFSFRASHMQGLSLDGCDFNWILNFGLLLGRITCICHIGCGLRLLQAFMVCWSLFGITGIHMSALHFVGWLLLTMSLDGVGLRWEQVLVFV